jgi:hypothetical protein
MCGRFVFINPPAPGCFGIPSTHKNEYIKEKNNPLIITGIVLLPFLFIPAEHIN